MLGRFPGRRAAEQRTTRARRQALAGLEFALAELEHDFQRLAELSGVEQTDGAVIALEAGISSRIAEVLARGERFATDLSGDEAATAWRALAARTTLKGRLGHGPSER